MNDAVAVCVVEYACDFGCELNALVHGQLMFAIQPIAQRFAVVLISARNRSAPMTGRELRSQNFHCDKAIVLDVLREVNGRHSARAELSLDAVAIRKCSGESLRWVAHRAQCVTKYT